jgi:hypothetical protein
MPRTSSLVMSLTRADPTICLHHRHAVGVVKDFVDVVADEENADSAPVRRAAGCPKSPSSDTKSHKDFAVLSHCPPSVHEARLGLPKQPSFLTARTGRATGSAREHDV